MPGMVACAARHVARVAGVRRMAADTWCAAIDAPDLASKITPGQFFMIRPAEGTDPLLGRPFALYDTLSDSNGNPTGVEFGFVKVGKLTSIMSDWRPGDRVSIWGPLGNGFPLPDCQHLICVAGGIGQTPFLGVIREALGQRSYGQPARQVPRKPESVTLCYGVRSEKWLAGLDDFALPGLDVRLATDDGSRGHHGYVTDLLRLQLQQNRPDTHVYCCGPEPMMAAVAKVCREAKVACWLSLETPMACGFGACFSCVTKVVEPDGSWDYRRTCVEGPVFAADRLLFHESV